MENKVIKAALQYLEKRINDVGDKIVKAIGKIKLEQAEKTVIDLAPVVRELKAIRDKEIKFPPAEKVEVNIPDNEVVLQAILSAIQANKPEELAVKFDAMDEVFKGLKPKDTVKFEESQIRGLMSALTQSRSGGGPVVIQDDAGEQVTVTNGKLDVNAVVSVDPAGLATEAKQDDIITAIGAIPGGGGIQYTEGDVDATITGTAALVEGAGNALAVLTQPLTDTQIRATALPVSGTVTAVAQPGVDIGDVTVNNASGASAVNIQDGGNSITVDGTFFQATQPVSIASMPSTPVTNAGTFVVQENGAMLTEMYIMNGAMNMQVDDTGTTIYQGWAVPGTLTSAAGWRIRRIVSSGTPTDTAITFADGDRNFDNIWDNRLALDYTD